MLHVVVATLLQTCLHPCDCGELLFSFFYARACRSSLSRMLSRKVRASLILSSPPHSDCQRYFRGGTVSLSCSTVLCTNYNRAMIADGVSGLLLNVPSTRSVLVLFVFVYVRAVQGDACGSTASHSTPSRNASDVVLLNLCPCCWSTISDAVFFF